ncbi:MAG: PEGA domain-containing protein [Pseudomonadota bacterium]
MKVGRSSVAFRFPSFVSGWLVVTLVAFVFGCATAGSGPPTVALKITATVPDATIWVDDHLVGRVSDFARSGKRLRVGFHRIEVRAPGHYSFFQEIDATPGRDVSVRADLHELLQ